MLSRPSSIGNSCAYRPLKNERNVHNEQTERAVNISSAVVPELVQSECGSDTVLAFGVLSLADVSIV